MIAFTSRRKISSSFVSIKSLKPIKLYISYKFGRDGLMAMLGDCGNPLRKNCQLTKGLQKSLDPGSIAASKRTYPLLALPAENPGPGPLCLGVNYEP